MNDSDLPAEADDDLPKLPDSYRFALSKNQKRRSKLMQVPDPAAPDDLPPPEPEPLVPPPAQIQLPPEQPRRARLRRSGHMHQELTEAPPPPPKIESEY